MHLRTSYIQNVLYNILTNNIHQILTYFGEKNTKTMFSTVLTCFSADHSYYYQSNFLPGLYKLKARTVIKVRNADI